LVINYTESAYNINNTFGLNEFKAWGRLINGDSPVFTFYADNPGTYVIETLSSPYFGSDTQTTDTKIELLNSSYSRIAYDNNSGDGHYSRIQFDVEQNDSRTFRINIYDSNGLSNNVKCYVIVELFDLGLDATAPSNGELRHDYEFYPKNTNSFYKIGPADNSYNCFEYVIDPVNHNLSEVEDDYEKAQADLIRQLATAPYNLTQILSPTNNCIVAYCDSGGVIKHFALIDNGYISSKMFHSMELVMHETIDCANGLGDEGLGTPCLYFRRN
jgi:hypothetical protein